MDGNSQKSKKGIGKQIAESIKGMNNGKINGLPQGGSLFDFISEIVSGYADALIYDRLRKNKIDDEAYKILRYRDDYRIFTNDTSLGDQILKIISEVLLELGLKLNVNKTDMKDNVIANSLKRDKFEWLSYERNYKDIFKYLMLIYSFGLKHPNSGTIAKALEKLYKRIEKLEDEQKNICLYNRPQLISLTAEIGYRNPRCFPVCVALISKFLSGLQNDQVKDKFIERIEKKIKTLPYCGHREIWLQRLALPYNKQIDYKEKFCQIVNGEQISLWNSDWVPIQYRKILNSVSIIDFEKIKQLDKTISKKEFSIFEY